jgi:UDP-N-acetylmuramoyl-tripeptide--D-alanyl-D-alanine ligase
MATPIPSNHCAFTLGEAAAAVGGVLRGVQPERRASSVSIDTRSLEPGAIFVALRGEADGHAYLTRAAERGAAAAIVETGRATDAIASIEVTDTLDALGRLAHAHLARIRAAQNLPVVTIGGAAGKTTTKELTAAAARAVFGDTLATPGNLNNRIGVPMTIFMLTASNRAAVLECGTNTRGEIARLGAIVQPDAAAVLNVAIEHSEGLGTLEEIADEEASIFAATRRTAVVPADDLLLFHRLPERLRAISFGLARDADVRVAGRTALSDGRARIVLDLNPALLASGTSPTLSVEIHMLGAAAALNCAAALAAVAAISPNPLSADQLQSIGAVFAAAKPIARRMVPLEIRGALVLDDSYNAQPPSMRIAIETAREIAAARGARLVLALGDMLELGPLAPPSHDAALRHAVDSGAAVIVVAGPEMRAALARLTSSGCDLLGAADSDDAARLVRGILRPGDVLLVKGSLGMAMDRVIDALVPDRADH